MLQSGALSIIAYRRMVTAVYTYTVPARVPLICSYLLYSGSKPPHETPVHSYSTTV